MELMITNCCSAPSSSNLYYYQKVSHALIACFLMEDPICITIMLTKIAL